MTTRARWIPALLATSLAALAASACSTRTPAPATDAGARDAPAVEDAERDGPRDAGGWRDVPPLPSCEATPTPAGPEVEIAPAFRDRYRIFELGSVPGVPNPLGGVAVKLGDPDTLLIAGASETPSGAIYAIGVHRDACGHILAFDGRAAPVVSAPYVDANLVHGREGVLLYTEWPEYGLSQLAPGALMPERTDLIALGIATSDDRGAGGIGLVPPSLETAGEIRIVTWPGGRWYHVGATFTDGRYRIDSLTQTATLPRQPGGFAYVPAGSSGFERQSIIVAEWAFYDPAEDRVATYEVDARGDPIPATRREFLTRFPRPWGAYFEPVTGDYMFLTWGDGDDRVYIVQGFIPPPF